MLKALLFDWGNTIMVDFGLPGPMYAWNQVSWVTGAEKALKTLSSRYICCLATNAGASTTPEVLLALKRVGADKYFSEIFLAKEIGHEKPDQRFFGAIIKRLGISPADYVMIGDNYEKDCVGAKAVGMKTIFFNSKDLEGDYPMADAVIRGLNELVKTVEKL